MWSSQCTVKANTTATFFSTEADVTFYLFIYFYLVQATVAQRGHRLSLRGPLGGINVVFGLDPVSFHWLIT